MTPGNSGLFLCVEPFVDDLRSRFGAPCYVIKKGGAVARISRKREPVIEHPFPNGNGSGRELGEVIEIVGREQYSVLKLDVSPHPSENIVPHRAVHGFQRFVQDENTWSADPGSGHQNTSSLSLAKPSRGAGSTGCQRPSTTSATTSHESWRRSSTGSCRGGKGHAAATQAMLYESVASTCSWTCSDSHGTWLLDTASLSVSWP